MTNEDHISTNWAGFAVRFRWSIHALPWRTTKNARQDERSMRLDPSIDQRKSLPSDLNLVWFLRGLTSCCGFFWRLISPICSSELLAELTSNHCRETEPKPWNLLKFQCSSCGIALLSFRTDLSMQHVSKVGVFHGSQKSVAVIHKK